MKSNLSKLIIMITSVLFTSHISINCMDPDFEKEPKKTVCDQSLECDRTFLGLDKSASNEEYFDCLFKFLGLLRIQDDLMKAMQTKINIEKKTTKIESDWIAYCKKYFSELLKCERLLNENRPDIERYLNDCNSIFKTVSVPIVCTTPASMATLLIYRNLVCQKNIPSNKDYIITKLLHDQNKEIEFLGKYFLVNKQMDGSNNKFEKIESQVNGLYSQFDENLKHFKQLLDLDLLSCGRELIKLDKIFGEFCNNHLKPSFLKKEDLWLLVNNEHNKQQKVIDAYKNKAKVFNNLIEEISNQVREKQKKTLFSSELSIVGKEKEKEKTRKYKKCQSYTNSVKDVSNSSSDEEDYESSIEKEQNCQELLSSRTFIDRHLVPDFAVSKKCCKSSKYFDGTFLKNESSDEIKVIDDPCNRMKIYMYGVEPGKQCVNDKLVRYPIEYKENVDLWFADSEKALYKKLNHKGNQAKKEITQKNLLEAERIHRFSRHVDRFIYERGIQQKTSSWEKPYQKDICITIPGHVEYYEEEKPKTCIFVYLIDSKTGQCYHRNIEFKSNYEITQELLENGSYKINVPLEFVLRKRKEK